MLAQRLRRPKKASRTEMPVPRSAVFLVGDDCDRVRRW
jgi:hypothetical protein